MKKMLIFLCLLIMISASWAVYLVGDTVLPADNIAWTITGPDGHPDVGTSNTIFDMVGSGKPVMIFAGQAW